MPFTLFPNLPTELRLQIWLLYFESPRIHILHDTKDADANPDRVLLTCTTIDAQTSIPLPPRIRTDISREAQSVALSLKQPRERIRTLTTPVAYKRIHDPTWRDPSAHARGEHAQPEPVDVDWGQRPDSRLQPEVNLPLHGAGATAVGEQGAEPRGGAAVADAWRRLV
ncbi:hypothetical protein C8A01DRAFT_42244 [Parachaetomium inaequale]|uniref:2EXR domain-containing protein n=1 Tax=Parachaetomium inaequale TaxID=2588326 RepID=A0AAN6SLA9_9PEZI|nr:hypothetical protein C8A01DRAFT_42244 [Parachaetomium inaequale]